MRVRLVIVEWLDADKYELPYRFTIMHEEQCRKERETRVRPINDLIYSSYEEARAVLNGLLSGGKTRYTGV